MKVDLVGFLSHLKEGLLHAVADCSEQSLAFDTLLAFVHRNWRVRIHPDTWSPRAPVADGGLITVDERVLLKNYLAEADSELAPLL